MKLYNTKALARLFDVTDRRVRQLKAEGVIEEYKATNGLYEPLSSLHKYINYLRKQDSGTDENINYNTERAKLVRAKRLNEEYDLKVKESDLHFSADIEAVMGSMLVNFKSRLTAVPAKLSPILSKKTDKTEIYGILKSAVDEALNELADFTGLFGEKESVKNEAPNENRNKTETESENGDG